MYWTLLYAMLPLIQREVVDRGWLSKEDFIDLFSVAQSLPGIFAVNISIFVGYKLKKVWGGIVCALGSVLPSFLIILVIALFFTHVQDNVWVEKAFKGLRPAVVALICSASLSFILLALWNAEAIPHDFADFKVSALVILLLALAAIRRKFGVIKVLLGSGVLGLLFGLAGLL